MIYRIDPFKLEFYLMTFCLVIIFSSNFIIFDRGELCNAKIVFYKVKMKVYWKFKDFVKDIFQHYQIPTKSLCLVLFADHE